MSHSKWIKKIPSSLPVRVTVEEKGQPMWLCSDEEALGDDYYFYEIVDGQEQKLNLVEEVYDENGRLRNKRTWLNGRRSGITQYYAADGLLASVSYYDGLRHLPLYNTQYRSHNGVAKVYLKSIERDDFLRLKSFNTEGVLVDDQTVITKKSAPNIEILHYADYSKRDWPDEEYPSLYDDPQED